MKYQTRGLMVKKRLIEESGGWEVVYTGFVLILLCFFIMLCSFSTMEEAKVTRFVRSFVNTLCILPGGVKVEPSDVAIPPSVDMVSIESELGKILQNLKTYTRELGLEENVSFSSTEKGLVMRLSDNILFGLGKAEISSEGVPFLKKISSLFAKTRHAIRIEGHTDNLPIYTKTFPSNWELSTSRAVNVLRFFLKEGGHSLERLSAVGFGEFQTISPNDTPEHRAKNRRVEIVLTKDKNNDVSDGEKP
ncbi:MAG: flagellar motor protein MotB [Deltaproteobacteria bacterium]|nr:flagellar motor protein MotB [Deltaproteobacteria bacterium]